jgi:selenide,water dikinase
MLPPLDDERVLVGTSTRDDAGVYLLNETTALVVTTDFFPPVVDDAFDFGRIAAANALSDIYAMGATPLVALNLVAFPSKELPLDLLGEILRGGADVVGAAGALIIGGHSIEDPEPKYGLAVVGTVSPDAVLANAGARPGDALILTKPLGSGVVTTALKRGMAAQAEIQEITDLMATLNRAAGGVFARFHARVHALTDVTGFGLLGHLLEMLEASEVGADLQADAVPILDAARRHAENDCIPGGTRANLASVQDRVDFGGISETLQLLLADAQTSGGLLAAVDPEAVEEITRALEEAGVQTVSVIGEIVAGEARVRFP